MATPPFSANDRRLKLLWIDDKPTENLPQAAELRREWGRVFSVDRSTSPEGVSRLLPKGHEEAHAGRRSREYRLPHAPYDVILADFRMSEPAVGDPSPAARAAAAGLTIAVLAAMQFPEHPVAIIPYSAYGEEYGNQWELLKLVCPPNMHVLWDESVHKGTIDRALLFKHATREYREALQKGVLAGSVSLPFGELDRWQERVAGVGEGGPDTVEGSETLTINTPWGKRSIGLDVLFSDVAVLPKRGGARTVPSVEIKKWLSKIPPPPAEERKARILANLFWALATSAVSQWRYHIAKVLARGQTVEGLDLSTPPDHQFPWIQHFKDGNDDSGYRPLRLAVLFLVLREVAWRATREQSQPRGSAKTTALASCLRELADKRDLHRVRNIILRYAAAMENAEDVEEALGELLRTLPYLDLEAGAPVSFGDVLRLVDPLPDKWNAPVTWNQEDKVAKAFSDPTRWKPPLDIIAILGGDGACLSATEKACARRYAAEWLPRSDWPGCLE